MDEDTEHAALAYEEELRREQEEMEKDPAYNKWLDEIERKNQGERFKRKA